MLFSVHIINVNGGKGGTVLDNLSVNINIYVCVCMCFFLSSGRNLRKHFVLFILGSFFFFLPKLCVLNGGSKAFLLHVL